MRIAFMIAAGLSLAACSPSPAAPSASEPPAPAQSAPAAEPAPATPAPEQRVGTMNLSCGGETFRVAFEDTRAVVVNADGSNTELPKLPPDANAAPGVAVYSDGKTMFTKQGGGDAPTAIKYAKARMAPQDCAIAQN